MGDPTCQDVWNTLAGEYSCGGRITWVAENIHNGDLEAAKNTIAQEFPDVCGPCASSTAPATPSTTPATPSTTPSPATCDDAWVTIVTDEHATASCGDRISWTAEHVTEWDWGAAFDAIA